MKLGAKGQTLPYMLYCISLLHIQLYGNLATNRLIVQAANSIIVIPPTTPINPNSRFPTSDRQFLRSHRPHAAPNKYSPFLKVVLV